MDEKARILIVDDDVSISRGLTLIFNRKGYATKSVTTGQEALEAVKNQFFDLALLDLRLPDIEGLELIMPLKEICPDMSIIMVTAYASTESAVLALNKGAANYLTKPLNIDETLATIRKAFEEQHLLAEKRQAELALQYRLDFENLITTISTKFIKLAMDEMDEKLLSALRAVGEFIEVDRVYVSLFRDNGMEIGTTYEWCAEGIEPQSEKLQKLPPDAFLWWMEKLRQLEPSLYPQVANLQASTSEKEILQAQGIQPLILVPMVYGETLIGFLGFDSVRTEKMWPEDIIALLKILGEIFTNALMRTKREEELRKASAAVADLNESLKIVNSILRHDILNDLMIIQGHLDLYEADNDETGLEQAYKVANKSVDLINRMRELEHLALRDEALKSYNVREIIEAVLRNYNTTAVEFNLEGEGLVLADPALTSVIDNIIQNALVHAKTERIDITIDEQEEFCELRIVDYGSGIPDKVKPKIFEPGFKYGKTGQAGLGLYIVRKVIARYGGTVWVENNTPKGTVFVLWLRTTKKD